MLKLNAGLCVRSLSVESECNRCELACPTNAIKMQEGNTLPAINFSECVSCGACGAVCPSEALALDEFSPTEFFFNFMQEQDSLISCRKNVPCIAALSVEHLISLAVLKKELVFDMGHCAECEIASTCKKQIEESFEEVSYILEAIESDAVITMQDVKYENQKQTYKDRREFLNTLNLKTVAKARKSFQDEVQKATDEIVEHNLQKTDIALLRKKIIPEKRKIFFTAIKRVEKPSTFHVIDATEVSFTSQKLMNEETCSACQMCYRVCPTGALSSDMKNSKIDFDPFVCIKCNICHDVCEPNAITLSSSYKIKEFFEPEVVNLIRFQVKRCDECGAVFSANSDDKLCHRCKIEDEEAKALWGIK
ncbi:NADH-quinone oxidoreductase subunit I [Sulfurimonas sp.]|uniref:NADH-quinone oxidoreductase subunit I n=1 Tax=Sulfurimonas sp. TaxID=2022749 RepID=UPI003D0E7CE5